MIGDLVIKEGEWISLNGSTGEVILGKQPLSPPALSGDLETFMLWADEMRHLKVLPQLIIDSRAFCRFCAPNMKSVLTCTSVRCSQGHG